MSTKQLLLDIIGLTYRRKLDWKLIAHERAKNGHIGIPAGKYFFHDSPGHTMDIYVRLTWYGRSNWIYVVNRSSHFDWITKSINLTGEKHLMSELVAAIQWSHLDRGVRIANQAVLDAQELVDKMIRTQSQTEFAEAVKGIK